MLKKRVIIGLVTVSILVFFIYLQFMPKLNIANGRSEATSSQFEVPIRSLRVDLSSMDAGADQDSFAINIINKVKGSGANTIYINPWSDGYSNYESLISERNDLGEASFLENFINLAHEKNIKVFFWYVVGKDTFPAKLHPEWYSKTVEGVSYNHNDEPGIYLPMASLSNEEYQKHHRSLLQEVSTLSPDGWVISEPLMSWGDKFDNTYADFSESALAKFKDIISSKGKIFSGKNSDLLVSPLYSDWSAFRSETVTSFVSDDVGIIRNVSTAPIAITIFTEPDNLGNLLSFSKIKEWLGMDIPSLLSLNPDYLEMQYIYSSYVYAQPPEKISYYIEEFRDQIKESTSFPTDKLLVSVQGWDVSPEEFESSIKNSAKANVSGISFYAFHTITEDHWNKLKESWRGSEE